MWRSPVNCARNGLFIQSETQPHAQKLRQGPAQLSGIQEFSALQFLEPSLIEALSFAEANSTQTTATVPQKTVSLKGCIRRECAHFCAHHQTLLGDTGGQARRDNDPKANDL